MTLNELMAKAQLPAVEGPGGDTLVCDLAMTPGHVISPPSPPPGPPIPRPTLPWCHMRACMHAPAYEATPRFLRMHVGETLICSPLQKPVDGGPASGAFMVNKSPMLESTSSLLRTRLEAANLLGPGGYLQCVSLVDPPICVCKAAWVHPGLAVRSCNQPFPEVGQVQHRSFGISHTLKAALKAPCQNELVAEPKAVAGRMPRGRGSRHTHKCLTPALAYQTCLGQNPALL